MWNTLHQNTFIHINITSFNWFRKKMFQIFPGKNCKDWKLLEKEKSCYFKHQNDSMPELNQQSVEHRRMRPKSHSEWRVKTSTQSFAAWAMLHMWVCEPSLLSVGLTIQLYKHWSKHKRKKRRHHGTTPSWYLGHLKTWTQISKHRLFLMLEGGGMNHPTMTLYFHCQVHQKWIPQALLGIINSQGWWLFLCPSICILLKAFSLGNSLLLAGRPHACPGVFVTAH